MGRCLACACMHVPPAGADDMKRALKDVFWEVDYYCQEVTFKVDQEVLKKGAPPPSSVNDRLHAVAQALRGACLWSMG